jgi:hypothetical protein
MQNTGYLNLKTLISENTYIKNCTKNKEKNKSSLSYLITYDMTQSDCIKLGIGYERLLTDIILRYTDLKNIKSKNSTGNHEKDHLFLDEKRKIIYYSELKANVKLDTEKTKFTCLKCLNVVDELHKKYPDYSIKWCLLAYRYLDKNEIPKNIIGRYRDIDNNIFGINQYLDLLGVDLEFTENSYKLFLNDIAKSMFYK